MLKRYFLILGLSLSAILIAFLPTSAQAPAAEIADTPWPMYQHDAQHTGRSPFLGPTHTPRLIWTATLPMGVGSIGRFAITPDGNLLISTSDYLINFDPVGRQTIWVAPVSGITSSTPLIDSDGNIYWGYGNEFSQLSPTGNVNWSGLLDSVFGFHSGAVFGLEGNIYYVHNGLWSVTPTGELNWYIPYGNPYSHGSPAIGLDGKIYIGVSYDYVCAFWSDGSTDWCVDAPGNTSERSPAISADGLIYVPGRGFVDMGLSNLVALNSNGEVVWNFIPEDSSAYGIGEGIALTSSGSIRFTLNTGNELSYLYSINSNGEFEWKVPFPKNPISGVLAVVRDVSVDREGNAYLCADNSRCYGISSEGEILWEFEFPLIDSIVRVSSSQPFLVADGLFFIVDNDQTIYAYADPAIFPSLISSEDTIHHDVDLASTSFTTTLEITSTVAPITYTASISPTVDWLVTSSSLASTPS